MLTVCQQGHELRHFIHNSYKITSVHLYFEAASFKMIELPFLFPPVLLLILARLMTTVFTA